MDVRNEDEEIDLSEESVPVNVKALKKRDAKLKSLKDARLFSYVYRFEEDVGSKKTSVGRLEGVDVDDYEIGSRFGGPAVYQVTGAWQYDTDPPDGTAKKGTFSQQIFRIGAEYGTPESKIQKNVIPGIQGNSTLGGIADIATIIEVFKQLANITKELNPQSPSSMPGFDVSGMIKDITKSATAFANAHSRLAIPSDSGNPTMENNQEHRGADAGFDLMRDLVTPLMQEQGGEFLKTMAKSIFESFTKKGAA